MDAFGIIKGNKILEDCFGLRPDLPKFKPLANTPLDKTAPCSTARLLRRGWSGKLLGDLHLSDVLAYGWAHKLRAIITAYRDLFGQIAILAQNPDKQFPDLLLANVPTQIVSHNPSGGHIQDREQQRISSLSIDIHILDIELPITQGILNLRSLPVGPVSGESATQALGI